MLEAIEAAFDEVPLAVECWIDTALDPFLPGRRDVRCCFCSFDVGKDGRVIVAAVGNHVRPRPDCPKQVRDGVLVMSLPGRECQAHGQAVLSDERVDFGAQPAARSTDGVIRTPFFPPAACWWARTMELSIKARELDDRLDSASKTASQMPRLAQRLNRL